MNRKWLLVLVAADLFILSILDRIAFRYFLYWRLSWFDIVMHLIGGLAVGLLSGWAYLEQIQKSEEKKVISWRGILVFNLSFAVVVTILWEFFELWADRIVRFSPLDSLKDVLVGIIGSLLAGLIIGKIAIWRNQKNLS